MVRDSREEWKTRHDVFDNFTERLIFKLSSQKHFDELKSLVSPGKEAVVFSATKNDSFVAVKIYKLQTSKFSKMFEYIRVDPRYHGIPRNQRRVTFSWAEREYRNLIIARQAGLVVPTPIAHKDNIIVMEFIGNDNEAAPLLKHEPPHNVEAFAEETFRQVKALAKAGFFHGDLSEFNIINFDDQPVFIDFSHMAPLTSANAPELLERDVNNVCRYFADLGVVKDPKEFIKEITS